VANPVTNIRYTYDASGNRISKRVFRSSADSIQYTWYVRDATGNVMTTHNIALPLFGWAVNISTLSHSLSLPLALWILSCQAAAKGKARSLAGLVISINFTFFSLHPHRADAALNSRTAQCSTLAVKRKTASNVNDKIRKFNL
jgi:hypothetical protein